MEPTVVATSLNEDLLSISASVAAVETTPPRPRLRELYPPTEAFMNGSLQVDSLHSIYYEVHGHNNNNNSRGENAKKFALVLHGGPGAGCAPTHARFFNPDIYGTIVLLDQRGSGRSTPRAQVYNNTVMDLIQDCEMLRRYLNISAWDTVLGGSWGTTLAITYAQEYPTSIKSLILRGVCLMRPAEIDWLFTPQGGAAQRNPLAWQNFVNALGPSSLPNSKNTNLVAGEQKGTDRTVLHDYYHEMFGKNATRRWNAARGWMTWEFTVSASFKRQEETVIANTSNQQTNDIIPTSPAVLVSLPGSQKKWDYHDTTANPISEQLRIKLGLDPAEIAIAHTRQGLPQSSDFAGHSLAPRPMAMTSADFVAAQEGQKGGNFSGLPALAMLTCFYSVNENYSMHNLNLLSPERMARIRHIPCIAIQGGRDPICPPDTALDVKEQWPEMELRIPLLAGHSMYHPEIIHELVQASDRIVDL
jgi:proline iminopeptidase